MRKSIQQELGNINIVDIMADRCDFIEQCRFRRQLAVVDQVGEKVAQPESAPFSLFRSIVNSKEAVIPVINRGRDQIDSKTIAHSICMALARVNKNTLVFGKEKVIGDSYNSHIKQATFKNINFGVEIEGDTRQTIAKVFEEALEDLSDEVYPTVVLTGASVIPNRHFNKIVKNAEKNGLRLILIADACPWPKLFEESAFAMVYYGSSAVDEDIRSALRGSNINFDRVIRMRSTAAILGGAEKLESADEEKITADLIDQKVNEQIESAKDTASESMTAFKNIMLARRDRNVYKPDVSVPVETLKDEFESMIRRIEALETENRILGNANLLYTITRAPERFINPDQNDEK